MDLPLHPKLVHLPIALAILMPLVSGGLLVAWWRGWLQRRAWVIAVALQAVLAASGVAALRSGEADEERVEAVVAEAAIEEHEEAAEAFVFAAGAALLLLAAAAAIPRQRVAQVVAAAGVAGTLVVLGLGYRTGEAGGRLVYEHGAAAAFAGAPGTPLPSAQARHHDDDD